MSLNRENHLVNYLDLIDEIFRVKEVFEIEIHPNGLQKFQYCMMALVQDLGKCALDTVSVPQEENEIREILMDCLLEHFTKRTITRQHLENLLLNWREEVYFKQA